MKVLFLFIVVLVLQSCAKVAPIPAPAPTIIVEPTPIIQNKQVSPPLTKKEKNTLQNAKKELNKAKKIIDDSNTKNKNKKEYIIKQDSLNNPSGSLP